jgi:putative acetyltransferase
MYRITTARPADLAVLRSIELAAARLLEGHAPESVLTEATSEEVLERVQKLGQLWVALAGELPVGFAHVEIFEPGSAHLDEIDVHPDHGRRGVGTRLVQAVCNWARNKGYDSVTLSTFRDVPWNMPFYTRLGFEVIPAEALTRALRAVVDDETRRGLDPKGRVVMRRVVSGARDTPISVATQADLPRLMEVWEESVRATHDFLSEDDLAVIIPAAHEELSRISPIHCLRDASGSVYAIMSTAGEQIEMLFVAPTHLGIGAGRRLVEYAIRDLGASEVDVNEQNHEAVAFYEHLGFKIFARDATDPQGLPFPILHMRLSGGYLAEAPAVASRSISVSSSR